MVLPGVLGFNLWMVAVGVPLVMGSAWISAAPLNALAAVLLMAVLGPVTLAWGCLRRSGPLLLVGFPAVAALPQALLGGGATPLMPSPPWSLCAISLVGYLIASAWALERAARGSAVEAVHPPRDRPLPKEGVPARWRRRLRVYRGLTALTVLFPLVLIWQLDLRRSTGEQLATSFGAHADAARALFTVAVGLLSIVVFRGYFVPALTGHLQHDREITALMEADRRRARRGRPRVTFYLWVMLALAAMAAVVWQRAR